MIICSKILTVTRPIVTRPGSDPQLEVGLESAKTIGLSLYFAIFLRIAGVNFRPAPASPMMAVGFNWSTASISNFKAFCTQNYSLFSINQCK